MKKNIFYFLFAFVAFASCNQQKALDYNNKLVGKENSLLPDITKARTDLEQYTQSGKFDSVAAIAGRMENKLDAVLQDVSKISAPDIPEAENFKNGYIHYYQYFKSFYAAYQNYGSASEANRPAAANALNDVQSKASQVVSDFQSIQKKFASANHMKMQPGN